MNRFSVRNMTRAAFFAALMAVCAWISIPVGDIACTMQTFAVFLTLALLGGKWGSIAIFIYLMLGAVGMPVFSGFRGGIGVLVGVTGGYLWGFLFSGLVYRGLEKFGRIPAMAAGLLACYACGSLWFSVYAGGGMGLILLRCVVPYLIPDGIKLWLAYWLSQRLARYIHME